MYTVSTGVNSQYNWFKDFRTNSKIVFKKVPQTDEVIK